MQQDLTEKTLATERKYTGKIISVDLLDIELPDGRRATPGVYSALCNAAGGHTIVKILVIR
mgnify:CR=1 FL=1